MATQVWLAKWAGLEIVNGTRDMDVTRHYNAIYGVTIASQGIENIIDHRMLLLL